MYEANSKRNEFRLEQQDGGTIIGTFDEALTETIRGAWNHHVRAFLRVTRRRFARTEEERPAEVEVIEIFEILDEH